MRTRAAALLAVPALPVLAVLLSAGPAAAHGDTIDFTITAQADGHTREVPHCATAPYGAS